MKNCLLLILVGFLFCFETIYAASIQNNKRFLFSNDQTVNEQPEPEWNTLNFKEIKYETNEFELKPKDLYQRIEECVKKCLSLVNPDKSYRDQCIAKQCDIY